jgi:hypothetical protein
MSTAKVIPSAKSDVVFQEIKLFIEGVQVPFSAISVSSALGGLPTAAINVPPQVGMMEIARFYNPKVHIFYTDPNDGEEKVLFTGIITSTNFSKEGSGSASITFQCVHRYQLITDYILDFTGWIGEIGATFGSQKVAQVSSEFALGVAMSGIFRNEAFIKDKTEVTLANALEDKRTNDTKVSPAKLPTTLIDYKDRFVGMPGVLLNMWQQFKYFAYRENEENEVTTKLYIPLIEDGLQFFKRIGGHYFIEDLLEDDRIDPCPDEEDGVATMPRIVGPSTRVFLRSAAQTDMSVKLAQSVVQFSGEIADILTIFNKLLASLDYEMLVLNCPAEVPLKSKLDDNANFVDDGTTGALDVIVKPQIPFYYAPVCNVLFPYMITSLSITQDEFSIPTRVEAKNPEMPQDSDITNTYYRGPASIREAIVRSAGSGSKTVLLAGSDLVADEPTVGSRDKTVSKTSKQVDDAPNANLRVTLGSAHNKVGKFEQGRGVKFDKMFMPSWLRYYSGGEYKDANGNDGWPDESTDKANFDALARLDAGWKARYGESKNALNPWNKDSGLKAYQRILVATADYEYMKRVARARAGQAECVFNPYIVPGYPMDILDATPNHPSFHAYCTSVTHNITSKFHCHDSKLCCCHNLHGIGQLLHDASASMAIGYVQIIRSTNLAD